MGKGGGCVPSKNRPPAGVAGADLPNPKSDDLVSDQNQNQTQTTETTNPIKDEGVAEKKEQRKKLRVFIVFYSMYGHVELLAKEIKKGVDSTDGVEGVLYRVPETLSSEVLEQMKVPKKDDHGVPVIVPERLVEADGVLFGFPTRYGSMAAQMKAFFDSTGELWREQKLAGMPAGFFVSTGTPGGGQETTAAIGRMTSKSVDGVGCQLSRSAYFIQWDKGYGTEIRFTFQPLSETLLGGVEATASLVLL